MLFDPGGPLTPHLGGVCDVAFRAKNYVGSASI